MELYLHSTHILVWRACVWFYVYMQFLVLSNLKIRGLKWSREVTSQVFDTKVITLWKRYILAAFMQTFLRWNMFYTHRYYYAFCTGSSMSLPISSNCPRLVIASLRSKIQLNSYVSISYTSFMLCTLRYEVLGVVRLGQHRLGYINVFVVRQGCLYKWE